MTEPGHQTTGARYRYRDLCTEIFSPAAIGVLDELEEEILAIYRLDSLLDTCLPADDRDSHAEKLTTRLERLVRLLPEDVSPMPNEVFTAIEFLVYEIEQRPVNIGEAWMRLELLADEIRARPLIHSLVTGRAN